MFKPLKANLNRTEHLRFALNLETIVYVVYFGCSFGEKHETSDKSNLYCFVIVKVVTILLGKISFATPAYSSI